MSRKENHKTKQKKRSENLTANLRENLLRRKKVKIQDNAQEKKEAN
jgi:hypothetical protein